MITLEDFEDALYVLHVENSNGPLVAELSDVDMRDLLADCARKRSASVGVPPRLYDVLLASGPASCMRSAWMREEMAGPNYRIVAEIGGERMAWREREDGDRALIARPPLPPRPTKCFACGQKLPE